MYAAQTIPAFDFRNILKLVCLTWVITKLICYKLWLADRLFPLIPVNDGLLSLSPLVHTILFALSLACMTGLLFFHNKKIILVLLIAELLSCCLDQNRWQPWEYQFIFMLAVIVFCKEEKPKLVAWQVIISGLYFFSGLCKLNNAFIHDIWQHLILSRWLGIGQVNIWMIRAGYIIPLLEMLAGISLLIKGTRRISIYILVLMHVLIFCMLGPVGLKINTVIWPWNLAMPLLLVYLFYKETFIFNNDLFKKPFVLVVILCWCVLPWLRLFGYWDRYFSSVLYSGGVEQLFICTDNPGAKKQMAPYIEKGFRIIPCSPVLSVYKWGVTEMKTAPYPEPRVYDAIIKAWKKKYPSSAASDRFYLYKPGFTTSVTEVGIK